MFDLNDAVEIINQLNIELDNFSIQDFLTGINAELEHGKVNEKTNITNDDPIMTAKIALAHLYGYPNYYNKDYGLSNFENSLKEKK